MTRKAIPAAIKRAAWAKNDGFCTWPGCDRKGDILEHIIPHYFVQEHTLDNLEPRCIDHAKEKTRKDQKDIGHIRRASGKSGQYARRTARKAKGQKALIQNAGFSKTMTRGFDGIVRERMK